VFEEQLIRDPALLKLDVQGFELSALQGCGRLLERFRYVYVEASFIELYVGQALATEVIGFLFSRGFNLMCVAICRVAPLCDPFRPIFCSLKVEAFGSFHFHHYGVAQRRSHDRGHARVRLAATTQFRHRTHLCGRWFDGSNADVVDAWALRTGHIKRIYERDHGIFDAMNKGLRAAKGEYVLFLNADDFLVAPDNPDESDGRRAPWWRGESGFDRRRRVDGRRRRSRIVAARRAPRLLARVRGTGLFPIQRGLFAKRRVLEHAGGFDASLKLGSDVNLFYDLERGIKPHDPPG